jgi:gamma-glutamyltranspeptidase/glutathione hydrolase
MGTGLLLALALALGHAQTPVPQGDAGGRDGAVASSAHGMVASAERHATLIGAEVLRSGGNAVDAAVAVAYALAVTHPTAGNLGGGGFMLIAMADGRSAAIDYREVAPAAATRGMYQDASGNLIEGKSTVGGLAAGIPGTVAGLALALERFGTKPHRELVLPAVRLAREGHPLDEHHAQTLAEVLEDMQSFPDSLAIYSRGGQPYRAGEVLVQKDLADTLQLIADQGPQAYYQGELARRLVAGARKVGAIWTEQDLAGYRAVLREPLRFEYRGHTVLSMPPPSSGGVVLAQMLRSAELGGLSRLGAGTPDALHLYVEIARRMYADRNEWLGDPDFVPVPLPGLLDPQYLRSRLAGIDPAHATPSSEVGPGQPPGAQAASRPAGPAPAEGQQTTHYSVVDRWGNAVSNTYTLNLNFGSKAVAPGTGVLLNNEMDDFAAKPGHPNSFGLVQGERNAIAPRKRMLSSMTPTIVLRDGKVRLVVGSPGGSTIITTVFQIVHHVLDHGWALAPAVEAPRVHHQGLPDEVAVEEGRLPRELLQELEARGHKIAPRKRIGAAHCIEVDARTGRSIGVVDPREGGWAAGPP